MTRTATRHPALAHLGPGWYAVVMGLAGLSLAWHRAVPRMGPWAEGLAAVAGAAALAAFVAIAVATVLRGRHHADAWAEDRRHPVRHPFVAALPISMILLATAGVALLGPHPLLEAAWAVGALAQVGTTLWVLARWLRPAGPGAGLPWAGVTPALILPVVGHVLVPLAGVPLGHAPWAAAALGFGMLFWPLVLGLLLARLALHGSWPERLRPTVFVLVAPPAVAGLALLQFGAPALVGFGFWGIAVAMAAWSATQVRAITRQPFAMPHWAVGFPLAALAALTLRLAESNLPGTGVLAVLGPLLLALVSLVVLGLVAATWRGLREGTLLVPEPVGVPVAVVAGPAAAGAAGTTPRPGG